ncbi:MAG: multicopper oxidase family protein [Acidobacteriota bacterium]
METKDEQLEKTEKGFSRRGLLKCGAALGVGLLMSGKIKPAYSQPNCSTPAATLPPNSLPKFVDLLPRPKVLAATKKTTTTDFYTIDIKEVSQQLSSGLPPTPVWTYNGLYPGPTIEAQRFRETVVTFNNNLPANGYATGMCVDPNVMGADALNNRPYMSVHLHGGASLPQYDGHPEDRFAPGERFVYSYDNKQLPATLWYHDHSLGVTRLNVYAGLAGFYLLRDVDEGKLNLPEGNFEVPLVIQDRSFNADGTLWQAFPWMPEFFGDYPLVNGKVYPLMRVTQGKYRFRILNGSNARFYNLSLSTGTNIYQIGTDGGLLPAPVLIQPKAVTVGGVPMTQQLLVAPAERADVVIDFSALPIGTRVTLLNDAPAPFPGGGATPLPEIMQFVVVSGTAWNEPLPAKLRPFARYNPLLPGVKKRYLTLVDYGAAMPNPPPFTLPYPTLLLNDSKFMDPITEFPKLNTFEIWEFINLAPDTHPIHVHEVQFQILDRQPFDMTAYGNALIAQGNNSGIPVEPYLTGTATPPDANEAGWKDTVRANPGEVTRVMAKFGPNRGKFVWHCHILDHEDNEMMRNFIIT